MENFVSQHILLNLWYFWVHSTINIQFNTISHLFMEQYYWTLSEIPYFIQLLTQKQLVDRLHFWWNNFLCPYSTVVQWVLRQCWRNFSLGLTVWRGFLFYSRYIWLFITEKYTSMVISFEANYQCEFLISVMSFLHHRVFVVWFLNWLSMTTFIIEVNFKLILCFYNTCLYPFCSSHPLSYLLYSMKTKNECWNLIVS